MPAIFGRFSKPLEQVLIRAQALGEKLNRPVQSDLVVLAMLEDSHLPLTELLKSLGADYNTLLSALVPLEPTETKLLPGQSGEVALLLEESIKLAAKYHFSFVEVEHLLFVIASDKRFLAHHLLLSKQVNLSAIVTRLGEWMASISAMQAAHGLDLNGPLPAQPGRSSGGAFDLSQFTLDLTALAEANQLDPVIGREQEIEQLIHVLLRRRKNNPLLIGEPGVGKTALVDALAKKIAAGQVPEALLGKRVLALDLGQVVAGTMYRGQFEERLKNIVNEVIESGRYILFLDEIHTLTGTGSSEGGFDAANILKPALARGELSLIGATTFEEYRKHIRKDKALDRRFQAVTIAEPDHKEALRILKGVRKELERHHRVKISDPALRAAVELSVRYINDRFLPDKAIDVLDEACTYHAKRNPIAERIIKLEQELERVEVAKIEETTRLGEEVDWQKAEILSQKANQLNTQLDQLEQDYKQQHQPDLIEANDVSQVMSNRTGVPLAQINQTLEPINLKQILTTLKKHVLGQNAALEQISRALMRAQLGLKDEQKPMGSFLLVGPTGVGKTETARVLAREIFGSEKSLIKVDMSEYMERHNVSNLIGAPAGYVGFEQGGSLTEQVWRRPYSVILFDEVEKAHPDVFNLLLQILEDGMLTDNTGRTTSFSHSIIIMTSNIGMDSLSQASKIGFLTEEESPESKQANLKEHIGGELKDYFKPELLGRLSGVIYFETLSSSVICKLLERELKHLTSRIAKQGITLEVSREAIKHLEQEYQPEAGARSVLRLIEGQVEPLLIDYLLKAGGNHRLRLGQKGSKLVIEAV